MKFTESNFWALALVLGLLLISSRIESTLQTDVRVKNESNDYVSVHWVNQETEERSLIRANIEPGSPLAMNSFLGHKFEVRQDPDPETGLCGTEEECKVGYFQITKPDYQTFVIKKNLRVEEVFDSTIDRTKKLLDNVDLNTVEDPMDSLEFCQKKAKERLEHITTSDKSEAEVLKEIHDELHGCMTVKLAPRIKASTDEVEFERKLRVDTAAIAENYTCVNVDLETSPDVETEEWLSEVDSVTRFVHKKLERPASRIHVIENFASPEECEAMELEAKPQLHVASTADGKGGSRISNNRKAMQAGIHPKFTSDGQPLNGSLISVLSGRVYEYTNHVLDMNITHHGQEPLMSIQYFGRGKHDTEPDRYTPHCDGRCNGEEHIYGGRMATMVIYCTIPEEGGFTNFQNANVHVKPTSGSAIFFSYIDPNTNLTDNGLTQHSGCPVYEGEKKIITQWVRYGVSTEIPHSAFNTLTILRSEDGE